MSSQDGDICRDASANEISRRGLIGSAAAAGATVVFAATRAMAQTGIAGGAISGRAADLVLVSGRIHTMDGADTVTDAVAIQAGRFIAIGAQAAAMAACGADGRLGGRTVFPGFIETTLSHRQCLQPAGYHTILRTRPASPMCRRRLPNGARMCRQADGSRRLAGFIQTSGQTSRCCQPANSSIRRYRPAGLPLRVSPARPSPTAWASAFDEWDKTPAHPEHVKVAVGDDGLIRGRRLRP